MLRDPGQRRGSAPDERGGELAGRGDELEALAGEPPVVAAVEVVAARRSGSARRGSAQARGPRRNAATASRTALIVPSPAGATSTTVSASIARPRLNVSPSAASGERGPPAPSTSVTRRGPRSHLGDELRDREGGKAEHVRRHRRRHRDGVPAVRRAHGLSRLAARAAEQLGVGRAELVGRVGLRGLARRDRNARRRGARRAWCGPTTSCRPRSPVPVSRTVVTRGRDPRARRASDQDLLDGVRGGERHPQPRGADGHRRRADGGDEQAELEQRAGRGERARFVAAHDRDDRRRVTGPQRGRRSPAVEPAARRPRCRARRAARRSAAAASAGEVAVVKMYDRARLTTRSVSARRPGDEAAERAERLRQRADAEDARSGCGEVGTEDRVGLVEDEQRAVVRADLDEAVDVGEVAVHREHGVAHHERAPAFGPVVEQRVERSQVAVREHRDLAAGEAGAVDDRRVVELVGAEERSRSAERGEHAEVRGEAGREEHRGVGVLPVGELLLELGVDRPGADDQPGRPRAGAPAVECGVRGGDDGGVLGEAEVVVRRERDDGPAVGRELPFRAGRVEVDRGAPLPASRIGARLRLAPLAQSGPRPLTRSSPVSVTSSMASASACTIRWISSEVTVSGGISTTTSPRGRMSTPRSTAAAHTRRPQRSPSTGGASSMPPISPRRRTSATSGSDTIAVVEQVAQLLGPRADVGEHVVGVESSRWRSATAAASAFPLYEWPWYSVRSERSGPRNASNTGTGRDRRRHREVPGGEALARGTAGPGRIPACSDANSVPVRPNPVATSSQISSTSCSRHAAARAARSVGRRELHPRRALHERLDDDRRELARVLGDHPARGREAVGIGERRRAQHREAQRVEEVGAEAAGADRQRPDRVAVVRAAEREELGAAGRRPGSPSTGTRSSAPARPRTRRPTRRGSAGRRPARPGPAPRRARRRPGCRCRASSCARRARAARCRASSSSGTAWPRVVTQSDEIASR